MKEIIITIKKSGAVQVRTEGFAGAGCKDASRAYENALGVIESEELKPEYYQVEDEQSQKVVNGNGGN